MPALRSSEKPKSILKKTKEVVSNGSASKGKGKETVKVESVKKDAKSPAKGVKRGREEGSADKVHSEKQVKVSTKPKAAKVSKKAAIAEEVPETTAVDEEEEAAGEKDKIDVQEDDDDSDDDSDDDEEVLHGLSDVSDADSSDEDDNIGEITKSGVVKLPSSRDDAAVKSRLDNVQKKKKESGRSSTPMVLYFGRVPKSMPEEPLRAYLSQFGDISRLRLSRNRKTGASKHYAFVEFEDEEVGQIVQETMNNYLLEGRLLQVRILPKEKVHPSLWIGANKKWRKVPEVRKFRIGHDEPKTPEEKDRVQKKLLKRQQIRRKKIQDQGIEYDFEGYA